MGATTELIDLVFDSRAVLVYSLSSGLNCIVNYNAISHNIKMSKKLWQAIGVWTNSTNVHEHPEETQSFNYRHSSRKRSERSGEELSEQPDPSRLQLESSCNDDSLPMDMGEVSQRLRQ
jgi:hypothetical protein